MIRSPRKHILFSAVLLLLILQTAGSAPQKTLPEQLRQDIQNFTLDEFSLTEAAFILSGVEDPDSLQYYLNWYETLRENARKIILNPGDWLASASRIFNYLHGTWLKSYQLEATTLLDVVNRKVYNCVSATILFNLICEDMGWSTDAFETPTHVLTLFNNFTQRLMVENTSPMGFNIVKNLNAYSRHLRHFYPENDAYRIGLDRLYVHEYQNGREIDNTELLGLLAYNQAYFSRKKSDFAAAYDYVLLAQNFNRDSRSNEQFERNLYYEWGQMLFKQKKYMDAFSVFADAAYRYPEEENYTQNTKAAFFKTLEQTWRKKDWRNTRRLTEEIMALEILTKQDIKHLIPLITQWKYHLTQINNKLYAKEAEQFLNDFNAD